MWLKRDPDADSNDGDGRAVRPAVVLAYLGVIGLIVAGFVIQILQGQCPVP